MFNLTVPWWELGLRSVIVYAFLFLALRLTGKRQVGQLSPFDFILLLILSNAVQNSMNAGDNSLVGGLISALALVLFNWILDVIAYKYVKVAHIIEGKPEILVHEGKMFEKVLDKEKISKDELHAVFRRNGILELKDVKLAMMEANGNISVIRKE